MKVAKVFVGVFTTLVYIVAACAVWEWAGPWVMLGIFGGVWLILGMLILAAEQGTD